MAQSTNNAFLTADAFPDRSLKIESIKGRLSTRGDIPTRSGIQKYSWQHQQAQNAYYRHMQNSKIETALPGMMASIDEGDKTHEQLMVTDNINKGSNGRQQSFAFESSNSSQKMAFNETEGDEVSFK